MFSQFFGGGGGGFHGQQQQRQGPNLEVKLNVPLRDFYLGKEVEFQLEKQQICDECDGSGSADGETHTCSVCGGRGVRIQKHMLAPGMFQQVQTVCDACGGKGKTIAHACPVCAGNRVVRKMQNHHMHIEKGMNRGQRVVFEGDAEESPDYETGDLIVVLGEKDKELGETEEEKNDGAFFRRKGDNLFWREVLGLREAWMGDWTRNLTHMDGHVVQLSRKRGEVVQPGHTEIVKGEGMPLWQNEDDKHGDLVIEYVVVLPDQMEKPMEKDFHALWDKWRKKKGVDLLKDSGRPVPKQDGVKDEL
jgi:DnaJ-related protein SCJ1